jgi:hypothetical protein
MSIDGHQKHSKAVENMGRNRFSTLASTLNIFSPGCCLPQAEVRKSRHLPLHSRGLARFDRSR